MLRLFLQESRSHLVFARDRAALTLKHLRAYFRAPLYSGVLVSTCVTEPKPTCPLKNAVERVTAGVCFEKVTIRAWIINFLFDFLCVAAPAWDMLLLHMDQFQGLTRDGKFKISI